MVKRCAVFASGSGSNFQALIDRRECGDLHVELALLIGNNSTAGAFEKAKKHQIPSLHLAPTHFESEVLYTEKLLSILESYKIDLIILAGYMKKLPPEVIGKYRNRIVNVHPGLLPAFGGKGMYGSRVHQAVIDYGAKISGITIHLVDEEYDHGPIILQESIKVDSFDDAHSLAERILKVEHANYWKAIEAIAQGTVTIDGRRVVGNVC
jgi:phosphoribosylglycinamide formyltransferase 1